MIESIWKDEPPKDGDTPSDCPGAVLVATLGGVILSWNSEAGALLGYSAPEVLGRHVSILLPPDPTVDGIPERVGRGETVRNLQLKCTRKGGSPVKVQLSVAPLWDPDGKVVGFTAAAEDVRKREAAERAARDCEELSMLFENIPVGMRWVGEDGTILRANREALEQLGYSREEYVGHPLSEFHLDQEAVGEIMGHLQRGEPLHEYETRLRAKDGSVKTVLITSSVIRRNDQVVHAECFTRDITELRQSQRERDALHRALEAEHERLRASLEQMPAGVIVAEAPSGKLVMANREVDKIWRSPFPHASGIEGYRHYRGFHPDDGRPYAPEEWPLARSLRKGEVVHGEVIRILRGDDTASTLLVNSAPILDAGGRLTGGITAFYDISELQEKDEEIRRLNRELERRVAERTRDLEQTVAELDAFTHTVSHDLRSPLRSLRSFSAVLIEDYAEALGEEGLGYVRRIHHAAERLDELTRDLLTYSRLSHAELALEEVDLAAALRGTLESMAPEIEERRARVEAAGVTARVLAHPVLLKEVLGNLISNAIKFVREGVEPIVRIRTEARPGGRARLWVEDNGIGIPPRHHETVFRIFERLHSSEVYPGTGIGLAIARRAVERMGGAIGVESGPGEGSRFWVDLATDGGAGGAHPEPRRGKHDE